MKMDIDRLHKWAANAGIISITSLGVVSLGFSVASLSYGKNTYEVHSFSYKGERASVMREEQLDRERHYIQIGDDQIFQGKLKADSGDIIEVSHGRYSLSSLEEVK